MAKRSTSTAGVQQAHKEDRITFTSLTPWPGRYICAEGRYLEQGNEPQPNPPPEYRERESKREQRRRSAPAFSLARNSAPLRGRTW